MKIGDLVKFKVPEFAKNQIQPDGRLAGEGRPCGLIVDIVERFSVGDGANWPNQERWCDVIWTEATGVRQTTESWENLEVVNEAG
jgi:hypothetical protein